MAIVAEPQFHVLAVDDSITDRKLIEKLLKTSCFHVTTVDSGSKALEFLGLLEERTSASVFSCQQEIDESTNLKDIPVVIMSSEDAPSRIDRCLQEGAEEYLIKPVQLSDMKKLRPHILKGKSKDHPPNQNQELPNQLVCCSKSNKRKAMDEEEFASQRTIARYASDTLTV